MKVLVIRFSSLGDVILTTAFLYALRKECSSCEIWYVTKSEFAEILKDQPYIDRLIYLERKENIIHLSKRIDAEFDCIFDLHNNLRSTLLRNIIKAKKVKIVEKHILYRYKLLKKSKGLTKFIKNRTTKDVVEDELNLLKPYKHIKDDASIKPVLYLNRTKSFKKPVIAVAPGARWKTKQWPTEYFIELINKLDIYYNPTILLFGSKDEVKIADNIFSKSKNVLNFVGKLSIAETASYMRSSDVAVSNDSGLMHMAIALDIPVVAMFGPTVKGFGFFPRGRNTIIEKNLECRPCSMHGSNSCKMNTYECMRSITPSEVFDAVSNFLEDKI